MKQTFSDLIENQINESTTVMMKVTVKRLQEKQVAGKTLTPIEQSMLNQFNRLIKERV